MIKELRDDPFLVYFSFYTVHTPLQSPQKLVAKYREKGEPLDGKPEFGDEEQVWPNAPPRKVRTLQKHPVYSGMVESMDTAVGRVVSKLKQLELNENTVICFMSDNGGLSTSEGSPTSNLPLGGGKGWLYEGGIREPFLIRAPGVTEPGSVSDQPVISTDFYPTMLELAGIDAKPQQHLDGVSLVPLLKGGESLGRESLYWHYPHYSNQGGFPGGAVREGDYKLVERFEDGRVHLFNLREDIGERTDLAEQMTERVASMRGRLHTWYRDVDAKFLQPITPDGPQPWNNVRDWLEIESGRIEFQPRDSRFTITPAARSAANDRAAGPHHCLSAAEFGRSRIRWRQHNQRVRGSTARNRRCEDARRPKPA